MSMLVGVVVVRLLFVQGINAGKYLADARSEYVHEISFLGERGAILDRNGDELAMSVPMTTVYADPYQVTNPGREAQSLAIALGLPVATLQADLSQANGFVYLARTIPDASAAKVQKLLKRRQPPRRVHDARAKTLLPGRTTGVSRCSAWSALTGKACRGSSTSTTRCWPVSRASWWRTWTRRAVRSRAASRNTRPRSGVTTLYFLSTSRCSTTPKRHWPGPSWPLRPRAVWL